MEPRNISAILAELTITDGVFKPNAGSIALAEAGLLLQGSFLEVGTGTGFISIVLTLHGKCGVACDISGAAVACAKVNRDKFGVTFPVIVSDLFKSVTGKFDSILFNPPTNANESESDRQRKNGIKKLFPAFLLLPVSSVFQAVYASERRKFLNRFIQEAQAYLHPGGALLMNIINSDAGFVQSLASETLSVKKLNEARGGSIWKIKPMLSKLLFSPPPGF